MSTVSSTSTLSQYPVSHLQYAVGNPLVSSVTQVWLPPQVSAKHGKEGLHTLSVAVFSKLVSELAE
jgi:hypothetical protein